MIIFSIYLGDLLTQAGIIYKLDTSSGAIGRRYARSDELAIPFAITIDFDTFTKPHSIVFRELDSLKQIRVNVDEIVSVVQSLSTQQTTWDDVSKLHPIFVEQQNKRLQTED